MLPVRHFSKKLPHSYLPPSLLLRVVEQGSPPPWSNESFVIRIVLSPSPLVALAASYWPKFISPFFITCIPYLFPDVVRQKFSLLFRLQRLDVRLLLSTPFKAYYRWEDPFLLALAVDRSFLVFPFLTQKLGRLTLLPPSSLPSSGFFVPFLRNTAGFPVPFFFFPK